MQQDMRNEKNTSIWNSDTTTRKKRCHLPATNMPSSCLRDGTFPTERRHVSFSMNTSRITAALRMLCLTALMMTGAIRAWGQVDEGLYYLANKSSKVDNVDNVAPYSSSTPSTNFYLCPAIGAYYDNNIDQPHLTTYQTNQDQNSIWQVVAVSGESNCYYLIHYKTGKYLKSNETPNYNIDGGKNRKVVHLEEKTDEDDDAFKFYIVDKGSSTFQIYPKVYKPGGTQTNASSLSLNVKGDQWTCYVPQNGLATGIIGVYTYSGYPASQWAFESVADEQLSCATPIIKYSGEEINISYPYNDETGVTIYYTTDGTAPTTSSSNNALTSFNIPASGVIMVRAFAAKTRLQNSDEAVLWGSACPFLIQSKEDSNYYLVPAGNGTNVNTCSLAGEAMQWTLQNAGASTGGVPYYYLVNSNGKKINFNVSDNTLTMNEESADANKFCIVEDGNSGEYFIIPVSGASTGVNKVCKNVFKNNGNVASDNATVQDVKANSVDNINRSHWILRVCNEEADQKSLFANPPFSVSNDDETHYYHIQSVGSAGYYIIPPATDDGYATTSNTSADYINNPWLFKVAATDNWLTYYYIINAATGKYMYFNPGNTETGNKSNVISMKDLSESTPETEEKFQFVMVRSTTTDAVYIVSKVYANNFRDSKYYGLWRDNVAPPLKTTWNRTSDNVKWIFDKTAIASLYLDPIVSQDEEGNITFSHPTNACDFYYTTDGNDPTVPANAETAPTGSTKKYTGAFLPEIGVTQIKVKAVAKGNYNVTSAVITYNLPQLSQPTIAFDNTTNKVTISSLTGATIYYAYGDTEPADPMVNESGDGTSPVSFTINDKTYVKALAVKGGFTASAVQSQTIYKVATPSKLTSYDGKVQLACATPGATLYYIIGDAEPEDNPTTSSTLYTLPIENASGKYIKAIAVKEGWITSDVYSSGQIRLQCATPVIKREKGNKFSISCAFPAEDVSIYYTIDGTTTPTSESSLYSEAVSISSSSYPITIKAIAMASGYDDSEITETTIEKSLTAKDGYLEIASEGDFELFVSLAKTAEGATNNYRVTDDISLLSNPDSITQAFSGTFDGGLHTISGLSHALFNTISGGTVKNLILDKVKISSGTNVGAIANEVKGTSAQKAYIYNCGILTGSVGGDWYVGGLVGRLGGATDDSCYARVINCYSFAEVKGGDYAGGIVGYNSYASKSNDIRTMVMNCMYYGNVSSGTHRSPVYGGLKISNVGSTGLNNYNYYSYKDQTTAITDYNCALAAEEKYLYRFEFYRYLLNSNRELAAWYATGNASNGKPQIEANTMGKWVLENGYPVLKEQGRYTSIINYDATKKALNEWLTITINRGDNAPTGAELKTDWNNKLNIVDKDPDGFNYNYYKVQLPYFCEVGNGNYEKDENGVCRVVTGWKITSISGGTNSFSTDAEVAFDEDGNLTKTPYNFADRNCTEKDLYSKSGRVFAQGAYFNVPEGVSSITIEPYWGKAVFLSDPSYDVTYPTGYGQDKASFTSAMGTRYENGADFMGGKVYTTFGNALTALAPSGSVYDNAIVLVGNYHHYFAQTSPTTDTNKAFTVMSADFDNDCEPDYSFICQHGGERQTISPIRFDFLNFPPMGLVQKVDGNDAIPHQGIWHPLGWFEVTNTCLVRYGQLEYADNAKKLAPLILLGGVYDQIVSTGGTSKVPNNTQYIILGDNAWFQMFSNGIHADITSATPHTPISVVGGEYGSFYLSGMFQPAAAYIANDNAECYINGGKFGEVAGAGQEKIDGNVTWQIDHADIENFYGGGVNGAKEISGSIYVEINNSKVGVYCGGPKFGNMHPNTTVRTKAKGTTFTQFFGAGYGGTSYYKERTRNEYEKLDFPWDTWAGDYVRGSYDSSKGIATDFEYEYMLRSGGQKAHNVGRLYVNYASLSLAETKKVYSILDGCTIEEDFYGGGNLGRVDGNIESKLIDCTIKGNVYGGGFSATPPTVDVFPEGAKLDPQPSYNKDVGVFTKGQYPPAVTYTWDNKYASDSVRLKDIGTGKDAKHYIYHQNTKDADLNKLGEVTGAITLIIDGKEKGTTIGTADDKETGSVFGGGNESKSLSNVTVTLKGNVNVLGDVFGGGNEGEVGGSAMVNIEE